MSRLCRSPPACCYRAQGSERDVCQHRVHQYRLEGKQDAQDTIHQPGSSCQYDQGRSEQDAADDDLHVRSRRDSKSFERAADANHRG